ncbi:MAG: acyl-phosphate glycerol 3-phosphate acyltransferase [Desulfobacteraceae bacterium 4572_88]|nr:MAG: acyl-phosphate glycerol 3-phosphate acyltransferase [Desulfobacteraceae bacterium 4572_88]
MKPFETAIFFILPCFAYILGSVPWGLVMTKMFASEDITQKGSGNIGATNVRRVAGNLPGILTLAGDMLKGAIPVYLAILLTGSDGMRSEIYISLVSLAAFLGHLYPLFMGFKKGGKGVATAAGCFLVISPWAVFIALVIFILSVWRSMRVSAGSLAALAVLPPAVWGIIGSGVLTGCALIITVFIYYRHKDNIRRLINGTEPRLRN